jgi:hypothetical protein
VQDLDRLRLGTCDIGPRSDQNRWNNHTVERTSISWMMSDLDANRQHEVASAIVNSPIRRFVPDNRLRIIRSRFPCHRCRWDCGLRGIWILQGGLRFVRGCILNNSFCSGPRPSCSHVRSTFVHSTTHGIVLTVICHINRLVTILLGHRMFRAPSPFRRSGTRFVCIVCCFLEGGLSPDRKHPVHIEHRKRAFTEWTAGSETPQSQVDYLPV